jgi:FMN phosphatase YigB (HAD superfamily)
VFLDDRQDNLATARALGMRTILVKDPAPTAHAEVDGTIPSIIDLPPLLASLVAP